jgi:putative ABC transport system permease protein
MIGAHGEPALVTVLRAAIAQLRAFPVRSSIAILSVAAGVAGIVAVMSLSEGLQATVGKTLQGDGRQTVVVRYDPSYDAVALGATAGFGARETRAVTAALPAALTVPLTRYRGFDTEVRLDGRSAYATVYGTEPRYFDLGAVRLQSGAWPSAMEWRNRGRECLLGRRLAQSLVDDAIVVGRTIAIAGRSCTVTGVVESAGAVLGFDYERVAFVSSGFVRALDPSGAALDTELHIGLPAGADASAAEAELRHAMRRVRHGAPGREDFLIVTAEGMRAYLERTLSSVRLGLYALIAVVLAVASIGVANIMLSGIHLRRGEIAVKRAVGATRRDIFIEFMAETVLLTLLGGAIGLLLGSATALWIAAASDFFGEATVSPAGCAIALIVAFAVGVLTGTIPAFHAARQDPVRGLHSY